MLISCVFLLCVSGEAFPWSIYFDMRIWVATSYLKRTTSSATYTQTQPAFRPQAANVFHSHALRSISDGENLICCVYKDVAWLQSDAISVPQAHLLRIVPHTTYTTEFDYHSECSDAHYTEQVVGKCSIQQRILYSSYESMQTLEVSIPSNVCVPADFKPLVVLLIRVTKTSANYSLLGKRRIHQRCTVQKLDTMRCICGGWRMNKQINYHLSY